MTGELFTVFGCPPLLEKARKPSQYLVVNSPGQFSLTGNFLFRILPPAKGEFLSKNIKDSKKSNNLAPRVHLQEYLLALYCG
jgi:hypothetical protein